MLGLSLSWVTPHNPSNGQHASDILQVLQLSQKPETTALFCCHRTRSRNSALQQITIRLYGAGKDDNFHSTQSIVQILSGSCLAIVQIPEKSRYIGATFHVLNPVDAEMRALITNPMHQLDEATARVNRQFNYSHPIQLFTRRNISPCSGRNHSWPLAVELSVTHLRTVCISYPYRCCDSHRCCDPLVWNTTGRFVLEISRQPGQSRASQCCASVVAATSGPAGSLGRQRPAPARSSRSLASSYGPSTQRLRVSWAT